MSDPTVSMNSQPIRDEPENPAAHSEPEPVWAPLVERIRAGDRAAIEELYTVFSKGFRFYLCRQLGPQDLDDKVHDLFRMITQSIQNGDLREPERLMGYARTVARRLVVTHIEVNVCARRRLTNLADGSVLRDYTPDPERRAIEEQNTEIALCILKSISKRDREVLIRFYLNEQPAEQICREMNLTHTQFHLIKSRAKARLSPALGSQPSLSSGVLPTANRLAPILASPFSADSAANLESFERLHSLPLLRLDQPIEFALHTVHKLLRKCSLNFSAAQRTRQSPADASDCGLH